MDRSEAEMKYMAFVGSGGAMPEEAIEIMNREFPAYLAEMDSRGVRVFGRELDLPDTAVTVRVRAGETLLSDGPFVETKEYIGGMDLLACADLDEAIEIESRSPVAWFLPFEIRPFTADPVLGPAVERLYGNDDVGGRPYLLMSWVDPTTERSPETCAAWRAGMATQPEYALGGGIGAPETAITLQPRGHTSLPTPGSFLAVDAFVTALDIVIVSDRNDAVRIAASHPMAHRGAIEVRSFGG